MEQFFNVQDLVEEGLVKIKWYDNGLGVVKYHNKVFYNNLWSTDKRLVDCRGTVVDEDFNIVTLPFTKVFNYQENGVEVDMDKPVVVTRKVNGFMAAVTVHKGELLVSTTGTLDSGYAELARKYIGNPKLFAGGTYLFEICDKSDPHIVDETEGAWLIGYRPNHLGSRLFNESELDSIALKHGYSRPKWSTMTFGELLKHIKTVKHEGYMVRDVDTGETLCKLKSPHYLTKKFFMRMGKRKLNDLKNNPDKLKEKFDEEYYPLLDWIESLGYDNWQGLSEQERKHKIEEFLECQH